MVLEGANQDSGPAEAVMEVMGSGRFHQPEQIGAAQEGQSGIRENAVEL